MNNLVVGELNVTLSNLYCWRLFHALKLRILCSLYFFVVVSLITKHILQQMGYLNGVMVYAITVEV